MSKPDEPQSDEAHQQSSSAEDEHPLEWDESPNNRKSKSERQAISKREEKNDARKIVTGESKYTADYALNFPDLAEAAVLRSDIAHGYVTEIDTSAAEAMEGVYAVITPDSDEVPDTMYTSAGQSYPEPSPWDLSVLRRKVRYVGDPIAAVAATDSQTADKAIRAIDITYEELDAVLDPEEAMEPDAPQIHDPDQVENIQPGADYERNIEAQTEGEIGDVDAAFEEAATRDDWLVTETEWKTPYQSHCVPEPHTTIAQRDEDNRFHLISSTQVPYHTRRQLAHLFDVPIRDIRVTKPRIGAGFGAKQSMLIEPITVALMLAADRPVKLETTRREQFYAMRSRRSARVRMRSVVTQEGEIKALDMSAVTNSGAYGPHGLTVTSSIATKPLPLYTHTPNIRFEMKAVHTNLPIGGAIRGYGAPQGHLALEGHMDEVANELELDPIDLRSRNLIGNGDLDTASGVTKDGEDVRRIRSCGIDECIERGKDAIGWEEVEQPEEEHLHRACGVALTAQKSGVAGDELGAAHIKMNEDGSFILQTGAVDIGPGADTAMAQIAAEVLGVPPEDVLVQPSDTDISPFDYGAYASSTTYVTGSAVKKAAEEAQTHLFEFASQMLDEPAENLEARGGAVHSKQTGDSVTIEEIGYESIYGDRVREQIMGQASHSTDESPAPFGAQFADVTVNEHTGEFEIHRLVYAVDCGVAINPDLAEGQVEGAMHMSYELAVSAGLSFDDDGTPETLGFRDYGMPTTEDQPPLDSILVETYEPTGPFGAKSVAEIPVNGVPPALSNAIRRAVGVRVSDLPITAEKIQTEIDND
ncbi:molybdopterin cofactor-binding domain-containing protein [Natronococcus sp. A-GB7]|uniref:xanthine dehydrogenase family protein molybdopterin-binding subunit n=1 Tax=Natronococcus sp. A-GB7 TaxID=3037649 RepID=UPI00241E27E2|nr:molybdopterin cofactor-binding domain-containing protein [Natronococcus sp. A-GB7]MDG5821407.1 molybdopterin-dependent oxidoreductase [Natronococcus sp. A-GB7]